VLVSSANSNPGGHKFIIFDFLFAGETLSRSLSTNSSLRGQPLFPSTASSSSSRPGTANSHSSRQRTSPLNSGLWITIELTVTFSQIIASIIVLSLSRHEHPKAPLAVWVAGYAAGCLATLPLLYWRYTHRYVRLREQDAMRPPLTSTPPSSTGTGTAPYVSLTPGSQDEVSQPNRQRGSDGQDTSGDDRYCMSSPFGLYYLLKASDCWYFHTRFGMII
jgi:hypothetical protein